MYWFQNFNIMMSLQVGSNGIVSFGTSAYNVRTNSAFSGSLNRYLLAPYWDDINIVRGGTISYGTFESGYLLEQVNAYLQRAFPTNFVGTWMMVAYYDQVAPYTSSDEVHCVYACL